MRTSPALALILLLLAGCGGGDAPSGAATQDPTPPVAPLTEASATDVASAAAEPPTTEAAAPTPAEQSESDAAGGAAGLAVVLEPTALGLSDAGGSITRLDFGEAAQEITVRAITTAYGEPTSKQDDLECGPGALDAVNWDGLSTYFQDGTFVGWFLQDPPPADVTTANGIGLGSKLGDLRAAYGGVSVEETTIGFEFDAGGLFGTLTADGDHDTIVTMWSGANCIAR